MPNVDSFVQFVAEEVNKEGGLPVTVEVGPEVGVWSIHVGDDLDCGETLSAATNQASQRLGFTHKDLNVSNEDSMVKEVAKLASRLGGVVTIQAPKETPLWRVEIVQLNLVREAVTLEQSLIEVLEELMRRGAE